MPTVIDELIVVLGIDPKGIETGRKKAAEQLKAFKDDANKTAKELNEAGKRSAEMFSQIQTAALELFAVFTGGKSLKDFIQNIVTTDVQLGFLSKSLDTSVQELSAWQNIMKINGGTADDANTSLQSLMSSYQDFAITGSSTIVPYLRSLNNLQLTDPKTGRIKDFTVFLYELADRLKGLDPARAQAIGQKMGLTPAFISILSQGSVALKKYMDQQKDLGLVTPKDVAAARQLTAAWAESSQAAFTLGRNITTFLTPALVGLLKISTQLLTGNAAPESHLNNLWMNALNAIGAFVQFKADGIHLRFDAFGGSGGGGASKVSSSIPGAGRSLLDAISGPESGGAYNVEYGGSHFSSYARHPTDRHLITSGPNKGKYTTAAGRYQLTMDSWNDAVRALGLKDFSPENQDKAAWWLAQRDYKKWTKRDLLKDLQSRDPRVLAGIANTLSKTWTSLPGGLEPNSGTSGFLSQLAGMSGQTTGSTTNVRNDTHIGKIEVVTRATDAKGIARDIGAAIKRNSLASQANNGPQ